MKLVNYLEFGKEQLGLVINNRVYNLKLAASVKTSLKMPETMKEFLKAGPHVMAVAREIDQLIKDGKLEDVVRPWNSPPFPVLTK